MEIQNKTTAITLASYITVFAAFLGAWASGALDAIDKAASIWGVTILQIAFIFTVGIGIGIASKEAIVRVKSGAPASEYLTAATQGAEQFLQAGLGVSEDTSKRITKEWAKKGSGAVGTMKEKFMGKLKPGRRSEVAVAAMAVVYPLPSELLAEFWQAAGSVLRVKTVSEGKVSRRKVRAAQASILVPPAQEYTPGNVQTRAAYQTRQVKVIVALAIFFAGLFAATWLLKVFRVI